MASLASWGWASFFHNQDSTQEKDDYNGFNDPSKIFIGAEHPWFSARHIGSAVETLLARRPPTDTSPQTCISSHRIINCPLICGFVCGYMHTCMGVCVCDQLFNAWDSIISAESCELLIANIQLAVEGKWKIPTVFLAELSFFKASGFYTTVPLIVTVFFLSWK